MTRLIIEEIKKMLKNKHLFILIASLLLINFFYIATLNQGKAIKSPNREAYRALEGVKLDEVKKILPSFSDKVEHYDFLVYDVTEQINRSYSYQEKIDTMIVESKENEKWSVENNNVYGVKVNKKIIDIYKGRSIDFYKYPDGVQRFLNNNFSTFLMFIIIAFLASSTYSMEYESKMYQVQKPTQRNEFTPIAKSLGLLLFCLLLSAFFIASDFMMFSQHTYLGSINVPLYTFSSYFATPLNISALTFLIVKFLFITVGLWFFGLLFSLVSAFTRSTSMSIIINTLIFTLINFFEFMKVGYLNPYSLLMISDIAKEFDFQYIFNRVILTPIITLLATLFFIIIIIWITFRIYQNKRAT